MGLKTASRHCTRKASSLRKCDDASIAPKTRRHSGDALHPKHVATPEKCIAPIAPIPKPRLYPGETHKNRPLPKKWLHPQRCRRIRLPLTREAKTACTATHRSPLLKVAVMFPGDGWKLGALRRERGDAGRYDRRGAAGPPRGGNHPQSCEQSELSCFLGAVPLEDGLWGRLAAAMPAAAEGETQGSIHLRGPMGGLGKSGPWGEGKDRTGNQSQIPKRNPRFEGGGASNSCHSTPRGWRPGQQQVQHAGTSEQNRRQ